eukprot:1193377-Prorocentrum_minimum.AAC.1
MLAGPKGREVEVYIGKHTGGGLAASGGSVLEQRDEEGIHTGGGLGASGGAVLEQRDEEGI